MQNQFVIDVVSDVICPWCFLGKRRLDKALASLADLDVLVRWRPYASIPRSPRKGSTAPSTSPASSGRNGSPPCMIP